MAQPADGKGKRPVVVELYTSQGCSSCPPADALLGQLSTRKDVLAVSLPVTYWDMLGWRDTLASDANTRRQKAYAKELGRGGVYTPQMIVDGANDVVGSRTQAVKSAIAARANDMQAVPVELEANHQQVHIAVGPAADHGAHDATIWLFGILPQATVSIGDGENSGRTITYHNVVREIRAVGAVERSASKREPAARRSRATSRRHCRYCPARGIWARSRCGPYGSSQFLFGSLTNQSHFRTLLP